MGDALVAEADWVLVFFAAGVISGAIRRWSGHLLDLFTEKGGV